MSNAEASYSFPDMIMQKRDGGQLSTKEIHAFVQGVKTATIQESQIGELSHLLYI